MSKQRIHIKVVVLGDPFVGKTAFIQTMNTGVYPHDYIPTIYDSYLPQFKVDNETIDVAFWDTAGQSDYANLRTLSFPQTDVFMLCFSLINRKSFENIKSIWLPEILHFDLNSNYILVGFQSDRREEIKSNCSEDSSSDFISTNEGLKLSKEIEAEDYIEISSKEQKNLNNILHSCLNIWKKKHDIISNEKEFKCVIN